MARRLNRESLSLHAHENPFRTEQMHSLRYRFEPGTDLTSLRQRFSELNYRAALVGPMGHGKTTLVRELADAIETDGIPTARVRFSRQQRHAAPAQLLQLARESSPETLLVIDGSEQVGWLTWRRFLRRSGHCRGVLITAHTPGRLPTLLECRTQPELLLNIVRELAPQHFANFEPDLTTMFARHDGNVRECLRELYDRCALL